MIDRKTGIPITLAILFAEVAGRAGIVARGVGLPGHFVVRVDGAGGPIFVDPFHEGAILDRDACGALVSATTGRDVRLTDADLAPCSDRATVVRMLANLKAIHVRGDDLMDALRVVRRLGVLAPADPEAQRDWGLIAYQTGHAGESIAPLERFLGSKPPADDAVAVDKIVRAARRAVAESN